MTLKLLLATKNRDKIEQIKRAFDHCECQIILAPAMSLALFLAQKNFPDLILTDMSLMDGDGIKLMQEIKAEPELAAIPFVFYVSETERKGVAEYLLHNSPITFIDDKTADTRLFDLLMPLVLSRSREKGARPEETPE